MLGKPHPPSGFPLVKWKDLPGSPGSSDMYCSGEHPFFSLSHSQSCRILCWAFPLPGDQSTPSLSQMTHGIPASQSSWTKWSKVAILSLLTLAQCLSTLGPQNPRETHSVEINEHLLPQTHLLFSSLRNSTQMYASLHHYTWMTPVNFGTTNDITTTTFYTEKVLLELVQHYSQNRCPFYKRKNWSIETLGDKRL